MKCSRDVRVVFMKCLLGVCWVHVRCLLGGCYFVSCDDLLRYSRGVCGVFVDCL